MKEIENLENYQISAFIAIFSSLLYLFSSTSSFLPIPPLIYLILVFGAFIAGVFTITQGIKYKKWFIVFLGILSLLILSVGLIVFINFMNHLDITG